ncbi:uracil-DNA glycosylase [Candidatus Pacearchaeota archaeon ex4484_26]|nr:MAG: uracil-DNA glycosylase [Candidatus Pacearchaeota archaeon ex4484_26]RLF34911.1 MAG: uracil-DNA glycosylase [Thermoplasmata archaeon]
MLSKQERMKELEKKVRDCHACELWETRTHALLGEGSLDAEIMFIAEAPGYNEDLQGKHFIGKAGKVFDELLDSIKLNREEIYITNVLKCKLPKRKIKEEYVKKCTPYLDKQIDIIKPKIIVPLGKLAASYVFKRYKIKEQPIGEVHGKVFVVNTLFGQVKVLPQFHPAVVTYNSEMLQVLIRDFRKIKE